MIFLEERPYSGITLDPFDDMWLNPTCYYDQPSSWSVMVKGKDSDSSLALPGWFWLENDIAVSYCNHIDRRTNLAN